MPFIRELNFHILIINHHLPPLRESQCLIISVMEDVTLQLLLAYFTLAHCYYRLMLLPPLDVPLLAEAFCVHT